MLLDGGMLLDGCDDARRGHAARRGYAARRVQAAGRGHAAGRHRNGREAGGAHAAEIASREVHMRLRSRGGRCTCG
eukprot:883956-Prorocentrum_minimum.AAC.1